MAATSEEAVTVNKEPNSVRKVSDVMGCRADVIRPDAQGREIDKTIKVMVIEQSDIAAKQQQRGRYCPTEAGICRLKVALPHR